MNKLNLLILVLIMFAVQANGQRGIYGIIKDSNTGNVIDGATIIEYMSTKGTKSDSNGFFFYKTSKKNLSLVIVRTGYLRKTIDIERKKNDTVQTNLTPAVYDFGSLDLRLDNLEQKKDCACEDTIYEGPKSNSLFKILESKPIYPGGSKCLDSYFANHFYSYVSTSTIKPFGDITIQFTVNKDGKVQNVRLHNEVDQMMLKHIQHLFTHMKLWNPAILNSEKINTDIIYRFEYKE